jgi:chromosomal replication initiation ATPase DnaA
MGLFDKNENWWLRFVIVLITVMSLATLSYYNKQIAEIKTNNKIDSLSYYRLKCDTLIIDNQVLLNYKDSIDGELFIQKNIVGRYEMGLDFLKERRPNEYNLLMNYIGTQTE